MYDHSTQMDLRTGLAGDAPGEDHRAGLIIRTAARVLAGRLDRRLMAGEIPVRGSVLAVHAQRLTTRDEREELARALRLATADADDPMPLNSRVPVHRDSVLAAKNLIDDITLRLHAPRPVDYRAVARLRNLMSDGTGPLYRTGRGSLTAELKAVLARM